MPDGRQSHKVFWRLLTLLLVAAAWWVQRELKRKQAGIIISEGEPARSLTRSNTPPLAFIPAGEDKPSETGFIVSAHRLPNITLLTLIATLL